MILIKISKSIAMEEIFNKELEKFIKERACSIDWKKNLVVFTADYKDTYYNFIFINNMKRQICYFYEHDPFFDDNFPRFIHHLYTHIDKVVNL
jgi:hypothetical protein